MYTCSTMRENVKVDHGATLNYLYILSHVWPFIRISSCNPHCTLMPSLDISFYLSKILKGFMKPSVIVHDVRNLKAVNEKRKEMDLI